MVIQPALPALAGVVDTVLRAIVLASATRPMRERRRGRQVMGGDYGPVTPKGEVRSHM